MCTGWIPGSLTIEHKTERKAIFSSCGHVLKVRELASHPGLLEQMKPGSIILNQRLKDNAWNSTIFNLPGGGGDKNKKIKISPSAGQSWLLSPETVKETTPMLTSGL